MEYALCSTTYNCAPRLRPSLESLERAVAGLGDVEWCVVDNHSTDGTWEVLQEWAAGRPRVRLLRVRCKRGRGRQLAAEATTAPFVVKVDLDTVYNGAAADLLRRHRAWRDRARFALKVKYLDVTPRRLVEATGGWRDLNYNEDKDMWERLRALGAYREVPGLEAGDNWVVPDPESRHERRLLPFLRRHFTNTRDFFKAGSGVPLRSKLRQEAAKTRRPVRFWALTAPMMAVAWLSQAGTRKLPFVAPRPEEFLRLEDLA